MESTIENQIDNIINYNSNQITYNHLFTLNSIGVLGFWGPKPQNPMIHKYQKKMKIKIIKKFCFYRLQNKSPFIFHSDYNLCDGKWSDKSDRDCSHPPWDNLDDNFATRSFLFGLFVLPWLDCLEVVVHIWVCYRSFVFKCLVYVECWFSFITINRKVCVGACLMTLIKIFVYILFFIRVDNFDDI